ncbi:hypothetical protein B0O80DRAFT_449579 [Mortierella sp. GBAus27b]|nr:hypothetical protein BGX31_001655 [Mortierella sp. GBA43]KAI8354733.1 hypothetical protein B0O80DRAFT_449579 [Mortierella sp. GBAus27b]
MPHIVELRPSTASPAAEGIGTPTLDTTSTPPMTKNDTDSDSDSDSELKSGSGSSSETEVVLATTAKKTKRRRQDLFSQLPPNVLQQILAYLPPFQMLTISELSRKFYTFVVLGQEMNEVWFRLVKHEEAEEKKRVAWFKQKLLEQEHRSVQMMRSYSGSSTCSTMSNASFGYGEESATPISKQAQRLLNKKQEAAGKSTSTAKVMKRSDRKKNWCKIYVDSILRGNGDSLEPLSRVVPASEKKSTKFQTITLNESLAVEHHKEYHGNSSDKEDGDKNKPLSREAKTQIKMEKRVYYKSIRSKPKGKKAGEMNSASAKIDKVSPWRHSEWDQTDGLEGSDYY